MRRFLPSLSALQAFESAARHLSFTRAAEDLMLTQSAVSRQIGNLETTLGVRLFERTGSRLVLTDTGRSLSEDVRQMLDRLEEVAGKIFRIIEKEPAKKAKASTFLNYYLPTTQKLLDSYAEFEEAGVSGENLNQAKAKIQSTMDSIVAGFERQLDELYRADAMDIDSDIRVMETMLRRDSATVADDFGLGGTAVQQQDE